MNGLEDGKVIRLIGNERGGVVPSEAGGEAQVPNKFGGWWSRGRRKTPMKLDVNGLQDPTHPQRALSQPHDQTDGYSWR